MQVIAKASTVLEEPARYMMTIIKKNAMIAFFNLREPKKLFNNLLGFCMY